ncbi:PREDICTED: ribonuclease HI-like [Fragaria vesca subsp. vesca]
MDPLLRCVVAASAGIAIENPSGDSFSYSFQLDFKCTNHQAEYEVLIIGQEILLDLGVREVHVMGDSLLVINQIAEKFKCLSFTIEPYLRKAFSLLDQFDNVYMEYIPLEFNFAANELAHIAPHVSLGDGVYERLLIGAQSCNAQE